MFVLVCVLFRVCRIVVALSNVFVDVANVAVRVLSLLFDLVIIDFYIITCVRVCWPLICLC